MTNRMRFEFMGYGPSTPAHGRRHKWDCNICFTRTQQPDVLIEFNDMSICPACVRPGPAAVAERAIAVSKDTALIAKEWDMPLEDAPVMVPAYRKLAAFLRKVASFEDLPGGAVAVAIANTKPKDIRRGYLGEAS